MQTQPAIATLRPQPRWLRDGLVLGLFWLGCLALALSTQLVRPAADPAAISGLYRERDPASPYQWTSSQVRLPLRAGTGPTLLELRLNGSRWPGAPAPAVSLSTEAGVIASIAPPERTQRYHVLLPPGQRELLLRSNVAQPPVGDSRWLGVQLHSVEAQPTGPPLRSLAEGVGLACLATLVLAGWLWAARRGYGLVAGLTLLGLGLRLAFITRAPPGWSQDEVISLIDALHIAYTGRDHLGNWLPLGAQEALGDWISPLLTYMELLPVAIFGPQLLVGRVVVALWGAAAVPLTYRVARLLGLPLAGAVLAALVVAISPWQIFLSRFALPPALGPTAWLLLLWAGLHLLQHGTGRAALALALAAGVLLHAYPTLKLAVPLFTAWAVGLALLCHGWRVARGWLVAGLLLGLLWLPFVVSTLFNPASSTRLNQTTIRAESPSDWLATWWANYSAYVQPAFYYTEGDGDPIHGPLGRGQQLPAEAPLALAGLAALVWQLARRPTPEQSLAKAQSSQQSLTKAQSSPRNADSRPSASPLCLCAFARASMWLFLGALLLAPLPASLTEPGIHSFRASIVAPVYALVVGMGGALLWELARFLRNGRMVALLRGLASSVVVAALLTQGGEWYAAYVRDYPPAVAWTNQDGLAETVARAVALAPGYDTVWISGDDITYPHVYLLAARPLPPAELQQLIEVRREPGRLNAILGVGRYRFGEPPSLPRTLPALEAVPDQFGGPGFIIQEWQEGGTRNIIVRRMKTG